MSTDDAVIQALRAALAASPESAPLRKHLGDLLVARGEFSEATKVYRQALDLAPDDMEIKLVLADAYAQQGKADVALIILEELMRELPSQPGVLMLAARAYLATGEMEQAAQCYQRAVSIDPKLANSELEAQLVSVELEPEEGDEEVGDLVFVTVDGPGALPAADIERPRLTFQDVGGMEKLKEEIRMKIIYPLTHPDIYQAYGKAIGGGILMYGPPGCGKTYLARATAGEVRAYFLAIGLHDVLDMYLGKSEQNLHAIFELARSNTPCVLFFDEVDALGASRSDMRYSAGRKVINQFLSELDGVTTSNEGVLILAATNAPWHLDPALQRPGRFDRVIFVPPPDAEARAEIWRVMLSDKPTDKIDYGRLARQTTDFSGADLKGVVDRAVEEKLREAMQRGVPQPLTNRDFLAVIKTVQPTVKSWFATARNYALYANESGLYNDILDYLKLPGGGLFSGDRFGGSK